MGKGNGIISERGKGKEKLNTDKTTARERKANRRQK